jgi:ATP-dependent DNA helicase RecG
MLSDETLDAWYGVPEAENIERKASPKDRQAIREAICALSNDLPGKGPGAIFVGQRDDLSCAGLAIDTQLLEVLGGLRREGRVLPFPVMSVQRRTVRGCDLIVIEVAPSDNPPVRLDGRTWIRVGPRRAIASAEEERRLVERRRWGNLAFDAQGVAGASIADLDLRRFELEYLPVAVSPEALAENGRPRDAQLRALRLLRPDGLPTTTAVLLLGTDPQYWFPGAYVQFLRVDGTELTDPIRDQRQLTGSLIDQLREVDTLLRAQISHASHVGGVTRIDTPDYPEDALRQLVRNAILHRTYEGTNAPTRVTWFSDRVEIQSPGGPFGQVTKSTFGNPGVADYRNPTLAEALKLLGFVERFGVGIALARERLKANGNPDVDFRVEDAHVLATVRRRP